MSETKHCAIVPARMERYNVKGSWFVTKWRVVDLQDKDILQPWFGSNTEAQRVAEAMGWTVV